MDILVPIFAKNGNYLRKVTTTNSEQQTIKEKLK